MLLKVNRRSLIKSSLAAGAMAVGPRFAFAAKPLKVGFVYPSPIADFGWSYRHEIGRQDVIKEFGNAVETTFVENVAEGTDSERVITKLARTGHDLIFTCSFGYMDPTLKVAKKFPNVKNTKQFVPNQPAALAATTLFIFSNPVRATSFGSRFQ